MVVVLGVEMVAAMGVAMAVVVLAAAMVGVVLEAAMAGVVKEAVASEEETAVAMAAAMVVAVKVVAVKVVVLLVVALVVGVTKAMADGLAYPVGTGEDSGAAEMAAAMAAAMVAAMVVAVKVVAARVEVKVAVGEMATVVEICLGEETVVELLAAEAQEAAATEAAVLAAEMEVAKGILRPAEGKVEEMGEVMGGGAMEVVRVVVEKVAEALERGAAERVGGMEEAKAAGRAEAAEARVGEVAAFSGWEELTVAVEDWVAVAGVEARGGGVVASLVKVVLEVFPAVLPGKEVVAMGEEEVVDYWAMAAATEVVDMVVVMGEVAKEGGLGADKEV